MLLSSQHEVIQEYISGKILTLTIYLVNNLINQIDIDWLKNPLNPTTTTTTIGKQVKICYWLMNKESLFNGICYL